MRVIHGFLLFVFALSFLLSCHSADGERYERVLSRAEQQNRAYDSITHVDSIHMAARWTDRHGSANERVRAPSRKEHPLCATILEESSGTPWKLTWYDACGRETATESVGEDGIDQNTYTAYNSRGLISGKTSVNGAITTMDSYTYDDMGRVASKSSTTGTSATYTYSNHSVSVSSAGRSYEKTYDDWGNILTASYCLNNPLKYTDPSGELFGIDDAFLIFSVVNSAMMGAMQAEINGGSSWKGALRGAAIATLSTIGTAGIGQVFGHTASTLDNELLRAVAHGVNGGAMSWLKGLDVGIGGITSAFASLAGSGAQTLSMDSNIILAVTTLSSSITSFFSKGNLMDGAMARLNIGMLNHGWKKLNNEWVFELDEVIVTSQYGFGHHAAIPREKGLIGVYPEFIFLSLVRGNWVLSPISYLSINSIW